MTVKILSPRDRQRLAEDAIAEIEERYNVRILGVIKTVNGGQQVITWEVVALPEKENDGSNAAIPAT